MKALYCSLVGRRCNRPGLCPRYLTCPHPDRCQTPPAPKAAKAAAKPKAASKSKKPGQVPRTRSEA